MGKNSYRTQFINFSAFKISTIPLHLVYINTLYMFGISLQTIHTTQRTNVRLSY